MLPAILILNCHLVTDNLVYTWDSRWLTKRPHTMFAEKLELQIEYSSSQSLACSLLANEIGNAIGDWDCIKEERNLKG